MRTTIAAAMASYNRARKIPRHQPHPSRADPLIEARAEVRSLSAKCARLQDENATLRRQLGKVSNR